MMDAYFARINLMVETPNLPSRLRFMLLVSIFFSYSVVQKLIHFLGYH
jgi:hypothetical protein